jgi:outer membrane protein
MKLPKYIFFYCLIISGTTVNAQQLLTPEEAIATALQNNYEIRLSRNDSIISAIDYSYANAALLPRLNANGGMLFSRNNQRQRLADGTKRQQNGLKSTNVNATVGLNWLVFDGLKMFASRDKLKEYVLLGDLLIRNQVTDIISDVIKTYYNIVAQKQELKAVEEQMILNRERLDLAQVKLDVGLGIKPDVLQAQVDLNAQIAAQLNQQTLIIQSKIALNRLMAVNKGVDYDVLDSIPIDTTLDLDLIKTNIANASPAIQVARKNIDISYITYRERRAERSPTVTLNSAYNFNQTHNNSVINSFSTLYNLNKGFNYGITANIPIFNNYTARRNIRQAQAAINFNQLTLENQLSLLNTNVENAFTTYELQKKELSLEESNIGFAKENVSIAFERYKLGVTTFIELREAQKSLADAYTRLITARYDAKVAETELLRLKGDIVRSL